MIANLYTPCPQPELAMGLAARTDHGFLTLLIQNDTVGLQVLHKDQWFNIHPIPKSFLANIGDHIEKANEPTVQPSQNVQSGRSLYKLQRSPIKGHGRKRQPRNARKQ
ncbi:hypothetical protein J1N35_043161 [Gossypium stocksii]|uniref:Isopenicillin N synthase-like Fe(2+) 2OG dioxygenase domain-containing protein n=1 Tax=Gossypium stocksii TaxID=47602 RepID=A0A9D3U6Y1_9ROSI|nr:hypothetical protein J1N35_043161 [Gossypium stocksii]